MIAEMEAKYGFKGKAGKLTVGRGKYTLTMGTRKIALDPSTMISDQPLSKLVKGTRDVIVIGGGGVIIIIIIIIVRPPRRVPIICYIPVPDLRRRIDPMIKEALLKEMIKSKVITEVLGRDLMKGFK